MPRTLSDDDLDEGDRQLLEHIESHGFHISIIGAEEDSPGWAFSVGLHHVCGHPEVAVFGLPDESNAAIVSNLGRAVREGAAFRDGETSPEVLEGHDCAFRTVRPVWYEPFLGYARWYYRGDDFPVVQCFWPDREGQFPWDEGFAPGAVDLQPLLFHEDPEAARAKVWLETLGGEG